jgi:hypothetical protein
MSFASWKQGITIEKHVISAGGFVSGTNYLLFQKAPKGTYFINFCPMITDAANDPIVSVECKIGSRLNGLGENLAVSFYTEPYNYKNLEYEQLCMNGVYVSEGYDLQIILKVDATTGIYSCVAPNANSFNLSIMKLS